MDRIYPWILTCLAALTSVVASAAIVPVPGEVVVERRAGAKPRNVVFILSDDHRYDAMSFMGHPLAETPNMDRLAAEGAHMRNALVTTALCSPSRASILTGLYTFRHRVIDNNRAIPKGTLYFPQYLQKAGYATAFFGKWHMGAEGDQPQPGFDHWVSFRGQGEYLPPSPEYTLNVDGRRVPQKGYITDELTDYAVAWLEKQKSAEKPFFLYLSHKAVHANFTPAERHAGRFADRTWTRPDTLSLTAESVRTQPRWLRDQRNSWHGVDFPYHSDLDIDTYYKAYGETLCAVDDSIGRVMAQLEKMGVADDTLAPHPGDEGAFVGGAVAANAGGARAVKYGTVRRFVLGLQVVLASGEVLDLGGKYIKSSSGYHLMDLMIGSEGTLGVITRITLGLLPPVGSIQTILAPFSTSQEAIETVPAILARGILPCAVEFVEHSVTRAVERLLNKTWPAREGAASLMIIVDGRDEEDTLAQAQTIGEVLETAGALDVLLTDQKSRQAEILEMRSMLYEGIRAATVELFDVCVPRSEIAPHVALVHDLETRLGISLPTFGHAADGNVHTHLLRGLLADGIVGPDLPDWKEKRVQAREAIYDDVARRGGVVSGEHGIGLSKRTSFRRNLSLPHLSALQAIKKALEPGRHSQSG